MKLKTFILTFLMMMSCSISFGQNENDGVITVNTRDQLVTALNGDSGYDNVQIKLGQSFGVSTRINVNSDVTATLDLNGYTLNADAETYVFNNLGKLTIKDSSSNGTGTIEGRGIYNGSHGSVDQTDLDAVLTIESGIFKNTAENGGAAVYNLGTAYIKGGEFYGEYAALHNRLAVMHIENAYVEGHTTNNYGDFRNSGSLYIGEDVYFYGKYSEEKTGSHSGEFKYVVAKIGDTPYASLQDAIDAAVVGDNTINILTDLNENVTVSQADGINIVIDGNNNKFTGTIYVEGNSRHTGAETLTIQEVNFTTNEAKHDFISSNDAKDSAKRYAHNVTVKDCDFTSTYAGADNEVVAMRFRQAYNIKVEGGSFTKLHSVMWATGAGGNGITVEGIAAENCKNGVSFGTSSPVAVKNSTIDAEVYAVRADGSGAYNMTIKGGSLDAAQPVIVRNTTAEYNLTVAEDVTLTATNNGPQVVLTAGADDADYVAPTANVNLTLYENVTSTFGVVAKIGNAYYATLQNAIDKAKTGETVTLVADCAGDVTVTQAPDYAITIDGNDKTFKGTITVDGKSARYETTALTIKDVNFDATEGITYDACVRLGGDNAQRYTNNVTVEDCTFSGNGAVAVKSYTGGDWNLKIEGCTVNAGMHSLAQVANIEKGLEITGCKVYSKNGINLNNSGSTDVIKIGNNIVDVKGYAVRIGVDGTPGTDAQDVVLANNTLKSACDDGDAVIMFRGTATKANFSMEKNVVSGTTHISGNTAATKISADANYWDGQSAPVVAEGSTPIVVNSYYADEALTDLVRNEMGTISAFVMADRLTGDVTTNAKESLVINIIGKDGNVIGTTSCEKAEYMTGSNKLLTWRINLGADDSGSWAMQWNEGAPSINNMPAKVEVIVDGEKVAESNVRYARSGDGNDPVYAARTNNEGKILGFIVNTGKFNFDDVAVSFNKAINENVNADETIELLAEIKASEPILINKSLTINGNCHNVTSSANRVFLVSASYTDATLNKVNMISTFEPYWTNAGMQDGRGISINPELTNVQLTLNNCSVEFTDESANDWTYAVNVSGNGTGHKVTVDGGTYEGANVINVHGASNTIVVKNATINCTYPNNDMYAGACIWVLQNQSSSVEATGNTFNGNNAVAFNLGEGTALTESDNTDNTKYVVARIDGGEYFYSLAEAVAAAQAGATVKILHDVSLSEILTLDKAITLDGNGKKLTSTATRAINVDCEGEVKVKYLTIATANNTERAVNLIQKPATLTLDNVTAEGFTYTINVAASAAGSRITTKGGKYSGYAAVNIAANNITFNAEDTEFIGINNVPVHESNNYAVIAVNAEPTENVNVNINGGKVTATAVNNRQFIAVVGETTNTSIVIDAELEIVNNDVLNAEIREGLDVQFRADYAEALKAQGYATGDAENGLIQVKGFAVAEVGGKYYATLQEAINNVQNGETITLLDDCAETVHINNSSVAYVIDGKISDTENVVYSGVIEINIGQNVTIKNIDFETSAEANHDFIKNAGSSTGKNYNTTLLVEGCSFTGNSNYDVVAVIMTHPTHAQIINCTGTGLHSMLQNSGGQKVTINNVEVDAKEGGFALGGVRAADVINSEITANGYGVRVDAATADATIKIESTKINAYIPVIARRATAQNVTFTISGENTMTQTNEDNVWFVIDGDNNKYHEGNVSLEAITPATGKVNVTLTDENLNPSGIYGVVAMKGNVCYPTLQDAIDAAVAGDNTINLLADVNENVIVHQTEGVNIIIKGNDTNVFTGHVEIYGHARSNGAETLTFDNVKFETSVKEHVFIEQTCQTGTSESQAKCYPHNVTVTNCEFVATGDALNTAVAMKYRYGYNIQVNNTEATGLHSLMQNYAGVGLKVNKVIINGKNGIALGTSKGVTIENATIDATGYGLRADAQLATTTTINGSTIDAFIPVVVRKASANYSLVFGEDNTMLQGNEDGYWCVIGTTEYEENGKLPTAATGNVTVDLSASNLSYDGVYGNFAVAKIGNVQYTSFEAALDAVEDGETITLFNITGSEISKEIEFTKDIEFTIEGTAPNYELPVITFQNATVNIKDAGILIPELDARQNATINVINSTVYDAGGNGIVKSYYNGAINIDATSTVYTMQVTTMGYINVAGTLNATWQTNVYGNGLITLNEGANFNTAALQLTAKDYSGRDNTDADRVGMPAEIVVNGANFTVGRVKSSNDADYSYNSSYGINIGTIEGKNAILNVKNGVVKFFMADGQTANIGAGGTVNLDASTFNVVCRAENGTATLANNGTVNVTGEANLAAANVTGAGWFYMNGVALDADTKLLGAKVRFASGTNNIDGSTIDDGFFQVGIGAYNGTDANVDTENGVVVNVKNAVIGANGDTYAGWAGTGFYDTDAEKVAAMTNAKYVLNIENSIAEFGYLHVSNDGELNVNGKAQTQATYNSSAYSFRGGDFIINGTATFTDTDVLAFYTKVSCDNATENPGTLNINGTTEYEAERHNGAISGTNFKVSKTGVVNVAENANLHIGEYSEVAVTAQMNIAGKATALGTITNNGVITLTTTTATLTTPETANVVTNVADYKVVYKDGAYVVTEKMYVASIGDNKYETLQEAFDAAENDATIVLFNDMVEVIPMNAGLYGKNVTITTNGEEVTVDWYNNKSWLFVGRGGEGNATLTFDNANLKSASVNSGIHVSGREKDTNNKYDGTLIIKNSNIQLTEFINRNVVTIENSTVTTTLLTSHGRPAKETETDEDATATFTLTNSTLNAKKITNGNEGYGIMNVDAQSKVNVSELFTVTAKGTLNSSGNITANIVAETNATIQLSGGIYTTEPQEGWCAENYGAFPYDETSWIVREIAGEQTIALTAGWNWMSSYISEFDTEGLSMLKTNLGDNGVQIKNNSGSLTNGGNYYGWYGTLNAVSVKEMYKVNIVEAQEFNYSGNYVNYDECVIPLYKGWNYIGYPVNERMPLADALAKLDANVGDVIKAQNGTAVYTEEEGWFSFDLTELVPGEGYMYQNKSNSIKQLTYTTKKTTSTDSNSRSSKYWTVDATQYPSNMTMIAMTDVEGGDYEVAAFVNGELRGSSRPIYVESLNAHILVLTISGDEVAEVTFKYYDIATGEEVVFSNRINYSNDAVVGSIEEPYMLTRGTTGIGEASLSEINIYPNPTTTSTEINLQAICDKVEVFNALGVKVAEYHNVDSLDALETAGIYVIRLTNNGDVKHCRVVVK